MSPEICEYASLYHIGPLKKPGNKATQKAKIKKPTLENLSQSNGFMIHSMINSS